MITPTLDVHEENLLDNEVESVLCGPRGGVPRPIFGLPQFRFNQEELDEHWDHLSQEADALATKLRAALPPLPPPPGEPPLPTREDPKSFTAVAPAMEGGEVWVALEPRFGFSVGEPIDVNLEGIHLTRCGDRGVVKSSKGGSIAVGLLGTLSDATGIAGGDTRILPFKKKLPGTTQGRTFADATASLTESPGDDWKILGPRSTKWLAASILEQGPGPKRRHFWWRSVLRLSAADPGVDDHLFLSELVETAACIDQLNISELQCFEMVARRYQLWEESYSVHLRRAEAGDEAEGWLDERAVFLGQGKSRGHALVCPDLEAWVAKELSNESAVLKERRKAREERQLASGLAPEATATTSDQAGGGGRGGGGKRRGGGAGRG